MIAKLKGRIDELKPTELILDVNGVGYHLSIPISTYEKIKGSDEAYLHVFTYHKEDQLKLFGFVSENERKLFSMLLNISGIGPSMALSILSGIEINHLFEAVKEENSSVLTRIPGIGKAKAEKLIFDLKRKIKKFEDFAIDTKKISSDNRDTIEALLSLGFDETRIIKVVKSILSENPDLTVEAVIKEALKQL